MPGATQPGPARPSLCQALAHGSADVDNARNVLFLFLSLVWTGVRSGVRAHRELAQSFVDGGGKAAQCGNALFSSRRERLFLRVHEQRTLRKGNHAHGRYSHVPTCFLLHCHNCVMFTR
jgi:hypothetical protein